MQRRNVSGNLNILMSNISSKLMERTELQGFLYKSLQPAGVTFLLLHTMDLYSNKNFSSRPPIEKEGDLKPISTTRETFLLFLSEESVFEALQALNGKIL